MDDPLFFLGVIIFLAGAFCAFRGPGFAWLCMPAVVAFLGMEFLIWDFLTPDNYPGDLMDMFLPFVTVPIGIVLSILALWGAIGIACISLWIAEKRHWSAPKLPLRSFSRLAGVFMMIFVIVAWYVPRVIEQKVRDLYQVEMARIIPDFFTGKGDEKNLKQAFANMSARCRQPYSRELDALLANGETERAALFISVMEDKCGAWTEAREDFIATRKKDGKIVGLETLLAANILDSSDLLEHFATYLLENGNHEDLMRIFSHYHPLALAEGDRQYNAQGRLVVFFRAGADIEILARVGKQAGNDPRQYLSESGFEDVCSDLLTAGAISLDTAFLNAVMEAGFAQDNTRRGSTLFSFVEHYGGPVVIKALLDAGVDPNILNSSGKTALTCLLQDGNGHSGQYTSDKDARIKAVMDILLPLTQPVLYRTTEDDTLLHWACRGGSFSEGGIDETRLLLAAGAKPDLAGPGSISALDTAREKGLDALLLILEKEAK